MKSSKQEFLDRGYVSIGNDGVIEYLARENEHGQIQYVTIYEGYNTGYPESINKSALKLLAEFISK